MSHIVKGRVSVAYQDKEVLINALQVVGNVFVDERLYRVGVGFTSEKYSLVLVDKSDTHKRIGYNLESGVWNQFQEDWGSYGEWTKAAASKIQDAYIAFHYQKQLESDGFNVTVTQQADGSLNVFAEEKSF
ncbi:hypothetical protein HB746_35520 [Pseudomonas aeruginosa]|uniref:hypothetical protein n=1 Tax=Pseudomonas aeruginosa TaxID=287 RepID=UPI00155EEC1A|nr:hypothetical protein [Pseudomonas aeruginosa]NRC34284.1 hypothetical protein [Pseudomonas aeruginosa]